MNYKTRKENLWAGKFGDEYAAKAQPDKLTWNIALFSRVLKNISKITSAIELGAGRGDNLQAIGKIIPGIDLSAVEINNKAIHIINQIGGIKTYPISILDFSPGKTWDFVLIKGVLIHIDPDELKNVYRILYKASRCYICIVEDSDMREEGNQDFAESFSSMFKNLKIVDSGPTYGETNGSKNNWYVFKKAETYQLNYHLSQWNMPR